MESSGVGSGGALPDAARSGARPRRLTEIPAIRHLHLDEPARWVGAVDTSGEVVL